ncbi:nuclear transport factor 2 family protein [Streptantibioticus parmotrematis]|uniref:nuclear transport factor 2 family protein n=1 Tax=Streptantibioticus parmotrematis TaxID=2873249 RepID=UPI00340D5D08
MTRTDIKSALTDLLLNDGITLEQAAERHFTPDYRQRTDGSWADRTEFLEHIAHLRTLVAGGSVEVHEELYDGTKYADRHTCHITKKDGSTVSMEVYVFADLSADGRFQRIEETTLMLQGSDADRDLGSARS